MDLVTRINNRLCVSDLSTVVLMQIRTGTLTVISEIFNLKTTADIAAFGVKQLLL